MRKQKTRFILFVLGACIAVFSIMARERVQEKVKVVNVEVPVRVFYKGNPVDHLTAADFKLYENKKQQTVSSLNIVKRNIKPVNQKPRYFVLFFRIYNYDEQFRAGVKYLFENILTENDSLLALVNNERITFGNLNDKKKALKRLETALKDQARVDRGRLSSYLKRIEQEIDMRRFASSANRAHFIAVQDFLKKYLRIWKDYKQRYLLPNLDRYYRFAGELENIKREKWVINFFQMEMLPNIIIPGDLKRGLNAFTDNLLESTRAEDVSYGRILRTLLNEVAEETNLSLDYPVEEIRKLLYKVDTTFHTIFSRTTIGVESRDHESMKVLANMEKCLDEITAATGGILVSANDVKSALEKFEEKEDIYYVLTYAPKKPETLGKIKIKTKKKYKVLYDDNMRADYIKEYFRGKTGKPAQLPGIRVKELDLRNKKLCVSICDFLQKGKGTGTTGHIAIRIRIESDKGTVIFDQGKALMPDKDVVAISIPLKNLKKGAYSLAVYATDKLTGRTAEKKIKRDIK